ncbi:ROK family transcriptional regulator [Alloyangia pacifica]|uniref:ROK family transcriptional regulator n=1 Tax=Alloyangia pacifica TaxID=311180 RepID=UPI001CFDCEE1|nr:ROK family transcriptional regulator [Alloyangia pacifica]
MRPLKGVSAQSADDKRLRLRRHRRTNTIRSMRFTDKKKIDQKTGRAINRRLILNLIRMSGGLSRSELAERTGLSPAAVGHVVGDLLDEGYLITGTSSRNGSGRKPVPLMLNTEGHLAIGVKVGPSRLDCILTDFGINVIDRESSTLTDVSPEAVVSVAAEAVSKLTTKHGAGRPILGVGLSVPGRIDPHSGMCIRSHRFDWDEVPIASMLSEALELPVFIEDDTLAFGLAHHMFGFGQACQNFAALAVGDGIGYAVISDAKVRRGALGTAGKVGHVLHDPSGPMCECGRRGCLQAWFSAASLAARWGETHSEPLAEALEAGDKAALSFVAEAGDAIGRHLAEWCTVTDPELIVLGGEAVALGAAFIRPMEAALAENFYRDTPPPVFVDDSSFYWMAGAAAVVVQQVFDFEAAPAAEQAADDESGQALSTMAP